MASEIRVDKINSLSGVGTVTLSPTGVDIAGITTAATLRATTGIVTTLTATTGIVTTLTANTVTSLGAVSGTTGTFSDDVTLTGSNKKLITNSTSSGDYIRLYAAGGTGKWDIYGNGANLRFSDNESAGVVQFDTDVTVADKIIHTGDTNTAIRFPAADTITAETGGSERLRIDSNGLIANNARVPSSYGSPNLLISGTDSTLTLMGDGSSNNSSFTGIKFRVAGGSAGDYTKAGIFAQRQGGYNDLDLIFSLDTAADANSVAISDEKLRITSAGRLGLNTDSPDTTFTIKSGGDAQMSLKNSSGTTKAYLGTAGAFGSASTDDLRIRSDSSNIVFGFSGTEKVRMLSGGGITFNGDTAAANALNDYEEGTWTPTVTAGGSAFGSNNASYIKIGKMVFISFDLLNNSGGNIYQVFGLPYAVAKYAAFNLAWVSNNAQGAQGASDIQGGLITTSTNNLGFRVAGGNNSQNVANGVRFIGSGAYETS